MLDLLVSHEGRLREYALLTRRLARRKLHGMITEAAVELIRLGQRVERRLSVKSELAAGMGLRMIWGGSERKQARRMRLDGPFCYD